MKQTKSIFCHPATHLFVLTAIVWLTFARSLGTYFLADDFGEISYASRIFNGEHNLLWANFTGNYMQIPGMAVWRPWLMVSIFADFCLWRANPVGYFLTNLLSYNMVVLLFYALVYSLADGEKGLRGRLVALLAGALFAVSPLHCESVSWVVGRVDIVCALFYLACLNLSVLAQRAFAQERLPIYRNLTLLAVACFWLGMWTKEMAIGAPLMVTTILYLFREPLNWKRSLRLSTPLWISVVVYFSLRYLVLGTLLGGYVQGIGDSQAANALTRWLDPDTLRRLFLPFAYSIFGDHSWQQNALQLFYVALFVLILARATTMSLSLRWVGLIMVWAATCLAPLYKLWGIGYELEGARFCFFLTMPLSLLAPALVIMESKKRPLPSKVDIGIVSLGIVSCICSTLILGKAAYLNNLEWVHAGQEVRELGRQAQAKAVAAKENEKILVLGIPKRRGGAHMVLNGATFVTALRPPFATSDYSQPFTTFDPIQFAECPYINSDRFKRLLKNQSQVIVWDSPSRQFRNVAYSTQAEPPPAFHLSLNKSGHSHRLGGATASDSGKGEISFSNIEEGDSLVFSDLHLNPLSADYLQAKVTILDNESRSLKLGTSFDDKTRAYYSSQEIQGAKAHSLLRIPLSRDWHWFEQPARNSLFLLLPPGRKIAVSDCQILRSRDIAPEISVTNGVESYEGVTTLAGRYKPGEKSILALHVSLPSLKDVAQIQVEISKANSFYENFPEDEGNAAIMSKKIYPLKIAEGKHLDSADIEVTCDQFVPGCYHAVRVRLLRADGSSIGELSCPITIQL